VKDGARLVGGCCRVTPDDIAAMADQLRTLTH
jgi:S-methylmethionine-dependent homocysteine/selenocysteine methylase